MSFEAALQFTLRWEGAHLTKEAAEAQGDPGGETKFGISKRSYPHLEIGALTLEEARSIYQHDFWNRISGDALPPCISLVLFDFAVNSGVSRSVRTLQRVVQAKQDGKIGPRTLGAVKQLAAVSVAEAVLLERASFLVGLGKPQFLKGWMRRVVSLAVLAGRTAEKET